MVNEKVVRLLRFFVSLIYYIDSKNNKELSKSVTSVPQNFNRDGYHV